MSAPDEPAPRDDARPPTWIATVVVVVGRLARSAGRGAGRGGRALRRRVVALFSAGGAGFRDLAVAHAGSSAGDTLVTIALAGTLFFSVPSSEARGNVALYLLLTVAPFAVIGPALGALLRHRPGAYRFSLVASSGGRVLLALGLAWQSSSLWLFPLAFGLLVLSRSHGISRNALLPVALDEPIALVTANAKMAQIGVLTGAAAAPFGVAAVRAAGAPGALLLAAVAFAVSALAGRRLPAPVTAAAATTAAAAGAGHPSRRRAAPAPADPGPLRRRISLLRVPRTVRLAQLATAVVRLLNGFLLLLLAFAFRDADAPLLDFGAVLGAAGAGYALASVTSPFLEARLREEPMVVAALALEAAAAFIAGQWFGLPAAAALAGAAGFAWGTAKLAFDGLLQSAVPAEARGAAFTRAETLYQLAWVAGAVLPTAVPVPTSVGLVAAGLAALAAQVVYVAHLLLPLRSPGATPDP